MKLRSLNKSLPTLSKTTAAHPLQLDRDFAGRQILGTRDEQQDSYAFSIVEGDEKGTDKLLVIIADGMGGYVGGREASLAAVRGFVDAFFEALDGPEIAPETSVGGMAAVPSQISDGESALTAQRPPSNSTSAPPCPEGATSQSPGQASAKPWVKEEKPSCPVGAAFALRKALLDANQAVDKMIAADPDTFAEAGTTLLAALVERGSIQWISVGDSPLLLWSKGKLTRLNADHSMRAVFVEKVAAGQMRAADIATHPERNALLAVLNGLEIIKIDDPSAPVSLMPGDMVIAASDGLLTLSVEEISKELKKVCAKPVIEIVRALLSTVEKKANSKQDNTTIAIIRV